MPRGERMNFRLPPGTRRLLRIALIQDGQTIQAFLASAVEEKIELACQRHAVVRMARQELNGEGEEGTT
jgi:hypothetical protein